MDSKPSSLLTGRLLLVAAFVLVVIWGVRLSLHQKTLDSNHSEVLYFHASWCGWCRPFEAVWNNFVPNSKLDNTSFSLVDYDIQQDLAKKFNVQALPSLVIVKNNRRQVVVGPVFPLIYNGQTLNRFVGKSESDKVRTWNECELSYFVKEKTVPKEMPCEKSPC